MLLNRIIALSVLTLATGFGLSSSITSAQNTTRVPDLPRVDVEFLRPGQSDNFSSFQEDSVIATLAGEAAMKLSFSEDGMSIRALTETLEAIVGPVSTAVDPLKYIYICIDGVVYAVCIQTTVLTVGPHNGQDRVSIVLRETRLV